MADSAVAITSGAGTSIDTRTEATNGNHRQVVVLGDPATNAGVAPVDATNGLSVTLTTALPAGTAAIGKLAANSGVDVGDVDVTSVVAGTGATNIGKAEDATHSTGDTGVMALSVRSNTAASTSGTDGDYQPLITDTNGRLHVIDPSTAAIKTAVETIDDAIAGSEMQVDIVTSALPSGAATAAKQDTGNTSIASVDTNLTALTKAEDAAHSSGDKGIQALTVRSDTAAATAGTDGDYQPLITDSSGKLHVNPGTVTVASHAVTNAGTFAVQNTAATPTGTNTIGSVKLTDGTDVADVLDLTNSNPVAVALVDTNGDQISSFGGGTQYTEDAAAAANPVGTALNLVRDDALSGSLTTADGDNVAARGNNKGEQYVKHTDPIAVTQSGTWDEVGINDSGNSITVDYATTGSGTATGALRVELPTNGTGVIATVGAVTAITNALPAGTNAIGKLAANSGVDIGDVDVTSVIPGTGATNLGKAIDTATGATDTGVLGLSTRDDALSTLTPAEGDNVQTRVDSTGALWVRPSGTVTVDGSGVTQPVSNAGLTELAAAINSSKLDVNIVSSDVATGGTSAADDADFTAGTTTGTPAMGVYESTPTSVTDGDLGTVGITAGRRLKTSATIDAALPAGTNNIGDVDVLSSALPTGASTSAKQDTVIGHLDGVETLLGTIDADTGTIAGAVSGSEMQVDVVTMPAVTNAGTFATQVDGAALTALQLIDDVVFTDDTSTHATGTTKGVGIMAAATPTDGSVSANDIGMVGMTVDRKLHVAVMDALPAGTAAIGKLAANSGVDIGDVDITSIAAGDNNIGNVDIVSGTITTVSTLTGGGIAHDSADSGNPHKMGAKAFSPDGTTPGTAVAENDRTDLKADLDGRLYVNTSHPRMLHKHLDGTSAYTDEALVADPGDGFQIIIKSIIFSSGEAVAINFFLEEGSTKIFGPIYIEAVAGRGFVSGPINLPVTASTAVTLTTSAANDQSFDMDYIIQAV